MRARGAPAPGGRAHALAPADQVVGVERVAGHVQRRALVLHRHADDGVRGRSLSRLTTDPPIGGRGGRACASRNPFVEQLPATKFPSISARNLALARWSSIGVPSPASTLRRRLDRSRRPRRVLQRRLGGGAPGWAWPRPRRVRCAPCGPVPVGDVDGERPPPHDEMSSKGRLAILWNAVVAAAGRGTTISVMSSPGLTDGLAVAGEVRAQRHGYFHRSAEASATLASRPAAPGARRRWASRFRGCRRAWRRCGSASTRTAGTARPAAAACPRDDARSR